MVERRSPKPHVDLSCNFFYLETVMSKITQFFKESVAELRKVVWPTRDDVVSSVGVVIVSTIVIAILLGVFDALLMAGVQIVF